MADGCIDFKIGSISFYSEGETKWVAAQLDKVLDKIPELLIVAPEVTDDVNPNPPPPGEVGTLASFLKQSAATTPQVKRFLATAEWLTRKGTKRLKSGDVAKALQDNQQKKVGNPTDCMNQNVSKGYCEKAGGREFFVTDDGRASLGKAK